MTKKDQIYKCNICGNIVEVVHPAGGELVCCGESMELLTEKTAEAEGKEKHVPVIEKTDKGIKVKIGSVEHPMEEKHFIEWIEVLTNTGQSLKKFLKPGDVPEAEFHLENIAGITARAFCNLHGLWKSSQKS